MGLDGTLRSIGDRFGGILNGIDAELWDPATDRDIAATYSAADLTGKARARADLLERCGFDPGDHGAVLGMIGRLDPQKGFDLVADAAIALVARDARLIVLGSGHPEQVAGLRRLAADRPDRVCLLERFDRTMARRIYAGADLFLMPSRFEPCGQGQMIALRYGTPPIVRRTGGLADTVVDEYDHPGNGTGFVFGPPTADALLEATLRAISAYEGDPAHWTALQRRGMALDFDWTTGSAPRYVDAYRRAIDLRRAVTAQAPPS
jgi:starch synthase